MHGGKFTWINPATKATYSETINDATESKIAAANARAATALSATTATIELILPNGQRRGNCSGDKLK
ncbi:MAG: hypothetical protein M1383_06165 [Patescibacteria group bacterium]|nr:hypothetical protein [Patescibacteria group bacterium]